jgi:hypothetical protein
MAYPTHRSHSFMTGHGFEMTLHQARHDDSGKKRKTTYHSHYHADNITHDNAMKIHKTFEKNGYVHHVTDSPHHHIYRHPNGDRAHIRTLHGSPHMTVDHHYS